MITIATPGLRAIALSAAATLAIGLAATPASAAVTYVFTGDVVSGYDETGVFGLAGQQLGGRGLTFTATIVREDPAGAYYVNEPTYSSIGGFLASSPVQATVTINGHTFDLGSYLGQQFQEDRPDDLCGPGCTYEQFDFNAQAYQNTLDAGSGVTTYINHGVQLGGSGQNQDFLASADYHTLGPLTAADGVSFFGQLLVENYTLNSIGTRTSYGHGIAGLRPTSLTVNGVGAPTGAVPEPASWALMILGFGAAGTMLRHRQRWVARAG